MQSLLWIVATATPPPPSIPPPFDPPPSAAPSPAFQTWEIALASGVGGVALLLFVYAVYLCYFAPKPNEPAKVQPTMAEVAPAKPLAEEAKPLTKLPTTKPPPPASEPAVTVLPTTREKIFGNKGCLAPNGKPFPERWGCPPKSDPDATPKPKMVKLPGKYGEGDKGMGSETLAKWIQARLEEQKKEEAGLFPSQKKPFPKHWGKPPANPKGAIGTPVGGYGRLPKEVRQWVINNMEKNAAAAKSSTM